MRNCAEPGIGCLTEDLLIAVFSKLNMEDRLGAGLASKRWGRLSLAPELWREITVCIDHGKDTLPRANSFASWIMKHAAGEVEVLNITIDAHFNIEDDESEDESEENEADANEAVDAVLAAVAACGRAPTRLRQLSLFFENVPDRRLPAWFATLPLRTLRIWSNNCVLTMEARLAGMSGLQELTLESVELSRKASLPPSLTRLQLDSQASLPAQVAALPRLKHLSVWYMQFSGEDSVSLSQLAGSLESLELEGCDRLPGQETLEHLNGLTSLRLNNCTDVVGRGAAAGAELNEALGALPGLVRLSVSSSQLMCSPPASLAQMSRLESLVWEGPVARDAALPAGPWLARLRQLAVPASMAIRLAGPTGEAARQLPMLRLLGVILPRGPPSDDLAGTLGSAARRLPALQRLLFFADEQTWTVPAEVRQVAAAVRLACPALSVAAMVHHELRAAMKT